MQDKKPKEKINLTISRSIRFDRQSDQLLSELVIDSLRKGRQSNRSMVVRRLIKEAARKELTRKGVKNDL